MNAATMLLKSVIKTKPTACLSEARISDMVSAATRREMAAAGMFKLSRPMDPATAQHLAQQRVRHTKWAT